MTQPTIHIKIKKDSPSEKVFLEYLEEKRMFREACEAGKFFDYKRGDDDIIAVWRVKLKPKPRFYNTWQFRYWVYAGLLLLSAILVIIFGKKI